jgi:hypothetical protein
MPDTPKPLPEDDLPDPVEAELVAFLDGELDPSAAHEVQTKLAADAALRAEAAALKKSFDLLDYLPKPEPSPEFATRTLDRLPAVKSGTAPAPTPSSHSGTRPGSQSTSAPIPLSTGTLPVASSGRGWAWAVGLVAAIVLAVTGGYFGMAAARSYFRPHDKERVQPIGPDEEAPPERVIRNLPLYVAADDLEFVAHLADDSALFDDEALMPGSELRIPWVADLPMLTRAFQSMPAERRNQIVKLDQQLHAIEAKERDRLFRALEAYCAWLDRLPEAERRGVLAQATPGLRLKVIRDIRDNQAQEAIPEFIRNIPDVKTRGEKIKQWEAEEADRRRAWAFAREHWDSVRGTRNPWPFDNADLKRQVIDHAKAVYRFEDRKTTRLQPPDFLRLTEAYREGVNDNVWLWFGWVLYDLAPRYEKGDGVPRYEMFPEPADGKHITEFGLLPAELQKHYMNKPKKLFDRSVGKWPDFPLAVHDDIKRDKLAFVASSLGPARVEDFADPARGFLSRELIPTLTFTERLSLDGTEGRWPEYARLLIRAARAHDFSIPGVMLPGKPSEWDRTYGSVPGRGIIRPKGGPLP